MKDDSLPEITFPVIFFDFQGHGEGEDVTVWSLGGGSGWERGLFGRAPEGSGKAVQDTAHLQPECTNISWNLPGFSLIHNELYENNSVLASN